MNVQRSSAERLSSVHLLKVQLQGMRPPVWRRLAVPSDIALGSLYDVIQVAFGWQDAHLHAFEDLSGGRYAPPGDVGIPAFDEDRAALADVLPRAGDRMDTYGFGDNWLHRVTVEAVRPAQEGEGTRAVCAGERQAIPAAEDLGGVWRLAEVLQRYEDGGRPRPTEVQGEDDGLYDEMLAGLRGEGFDPAAFDPAKVTRALAGVRLRRSADAWRDGCSKQGGRRVPPGMYCCECGGLHPLSGGAGTVVVDAGGKGQVGVEAEEEPLSSLLLGAAEVRLPAVRLLGEAELAGAVRAAPAFMAAVRLGHWCRGERELTSKELLRPKLARQTVEEAELWRIAPEEWGDPEARATQLAKIRSAGDMELVGLPWTWALNCGFVEVDGTRAYAGDELPLEDDDAALLAAWQGAVAGAVAELSLSDPELDGPLGGLLSLTYRVPPLGFLMLLAAYELPDGEWLDVAGHLACGLEGLAGGRARKLVSALLAEEYEETAGVLELFGAAEREGCEREEVDGPLTVLLDGRGRDWLPSGRFRLTPLGRCGLRELWTRVGIPAPVIGSLAQADAGEPLHSLPSYSSEEDAAQEVAGWLATRSPADAAVQVVDACAGTEPADALRRLQAPRVLTAVLEADAAGRAKVVLRKAAVSTVTGCSHTAASMLRRIGEPAEGEAARGLEWMLVDGALPFARRGEQALREGLLTVPDDGTRSLSQVAERADDLWRAGHSHTREMLGALAHAVKPVDKTLAKRLRKAAFKAGSAK
ncbi:plasmid pRiA4b ORF-3 family protein [Streptomyces sp. NPDC090442]|uniref:plasmid pRiA4b ORF-3 family protein n=1 Tax=Streptomyces sp. NPDC090442 TaxID=3365962 RepID=UPI00380F03E1